MGFGKKLKKAFKKVGGIFKKAWKAISKLVETVAKAIVDALKWVWKDIIMPILDFIANLLGLKDKDLIQVSANTQPLFDEKLAWLFNDNIILKSLLHGTDVVDEMRATILYGQHNDVRAYARYGEKHYYRGLPTVTLSAGKTTNTDASILGMWKIHCDLYGYPNPFTTVESLPIRDYRFDIAEPTADSVVLTELLTNYRYNTADNTLVSNGNLYFVIEGTRTVELVKIGDDPNYDPTTPDDDPDQESMLTEIVTVNWTLQAERADQYVQSALPTIKDGSTLVLAPIMVGDYTINDEPLGIPVQTGAEIDLSDIPDTEFPLTLAFTEPVREGYTVDFEITRTEYTDPITSEVTLSFEIIAGELEADPLNNPDIVLLSGSVQDALAPYFQFTFYVTDPEYSPYPDNTDYQFNYQVPQERTTDADFTGGGSNDSIFENYPEDFMDALPVVILKEEGQWADHDKSSTGYVTGNKLLTKIGLQIQPLIDGIRSSSPDADEELQTAVFRLGVDIMSKNQGCLAYVFEFLNFIHATSIASKNDFDNSDREDAEGAIQGRTTNNIMLQEGSFNSSYQYSYSTRAAVTDIPVKRRGFYETTATNSDYTITRHNGDGTGVRLFFKSLAGAYVITPTGSPKAKMAAMSFTESDDPDYNSSFVIPIMVGAFRKITPLQREEVIARSQWLTVTSGTYEKLRWYKSPAFLQIIGVIIIIVVTIVTWGAGSGYAAAIAAAMTAGVAALVTVVVSIAIQMIIAYAKTRLIMFILQKILSQFAGQEWAQVIAMIAAAVAAYYVGGMDVTEIVLNITQASTEYYGRELASEAKQLATEIQSTQTSLEVLGAEHQAAMDSMTINPIGLSALYDYKAESPELFFSRVEMDSTTLLSSFDSLMGLELDLDFMLS